MAKGYGRNISFGWVLFQIAAGWFAIGIAYCAIHDVLGGTP